VKGIILSINPHATIIDITHSIRPQDIDEAAYIVGSSFSYFPPGTIHIVVVDPGVGSGRKAVILEAGGQYFVGPDNGVFSHVLTFTPPVRGVYITEENYMLSRESPTFQGRDVFAPAAAWLSKGVRIEEFGPSAQDFVASSIRLPEVAGGKIFGEVIYIDHFGNAITNIKAEVIALLGGRYAVEVESTPVSRVKYYAQAGKNTLSCLVNSSGYLELFVRDGSAAEKYGVRKKDKIIVRSLAI
jgi:S-adenosylmethionine hydrolase